jgi:hypothetical protein
MLNEVKRYLAITWNDADTDANIQDSINEGSQYLSTLVGTGIDFGSDLEAKALLKDYCRYTRNYSLEYFKTNFLSELLRLQLKYAITTDAETPSI